MDATKHTFSLLNGNKAILLNFLSFDPTLKSHPKRATGMHGLPIAVGGSLASAVPRSVYLLLLMLRWLVGLRCEVAGKLHQNHPIFCPLIGWRPSKARTQEYVRIDPTNRRHR